MNAQLKLIRNNFGSLLFAWVVIAFFSFLIGCDDVNKEKSSVTKQTANQEKSGKDSPCLSLRLDTLLLRHGQLDSLMASKGREKLIVQLRLTAEGKLSIGLWPAKNGNKEIDTANVQVLTNLGPSISVAGMHVYFGDQQVTDNTYKSLKDYSKDSTKQFIFIPKIIPGNHVAYDIGYETTSLEGTTSVTIIGSSNPSPPKDAE